jgi:glycosyltransferase 2 family protein
MRKYWLAILQGLLSLILIGHIFGSPTVRAEVLKVLTNASPEWLALGLTTAILTESLCAVRWWYMLRLFGTPVSMARVFAFCGAGLFFSLGLPGTGGGDAFRIIYLIRLYPGRKLRAALSVLADRLCGLVSLVLAFSATMLFRHHLFNFDPHTQSLLRAASLLLGSVVILVFLWWLTTMRPVRALWLPFDTFRKKADRLRYVFPLLTSSPRFLAAGILTSCAALAFHFSTYFCSARAFNIQVKLVDIFTVMPVIDTLILLPITLFGVGLRETLFEQLLGGMFGVPQGAATLASLGGFGLQATVALLGGLLIPFTTPSLKNQ